MLTSCVKCKIGITARTKSKKGTTGGWICGEYMNHTTIKVNNGTCKTGKEN